MACCKLRGKTFFTSPRPTPGRKLLDGNMQKIIWGQPVWLIKLWTPEGKHFFLWGGSIFAKKKLVALRKLFLALRTGLKLEQYSVG